MSLRFTTSTTHERVYVIFVFLTNSRNLFLISSLSIITGVMLLQFEFAYAAEGSFIVAFLIALIAVVLSIKEDYDNRDSPLYDSRIYRKESSNSKHTDHTLKKQSTVAAVPTPEITSAITPQEIKLRMKH